MMYTFTRMWKHAWKLAVLTAALVLPGAAVSYAQSAPPVMPDHTVYGRLGTGTGSGPGQAIPFGTLFSFSINTTVTPQQFGAKCDGTTDDSTAFQSAINAAETAALPLRWVGECAIGTGLNVTASLDLGGTGFTVNGSFSGVSTLIAITNSMQMITVNTIANVNFHDFLLSSGATTGGTAITLTSPTSYNAGSIFSKIGINGFSTCFSTGAAGAFIIDSSWFLNCSSQGVFVQNTFNADDGDATIANSYFIGNTQNMIRYASGGGLRIINNKFNNASTANVGIQLAAAAGINTSDLIITSNSIEGNGNAIALQRSASANFGNIIISNNEISAGGVSGSCVSAATDTQWMTHVIVSNNVCVSLSTGSNIAFVFATPVPGLNITNNSVLGQGSTNVAVTTSTQTAADCTVGLITKRGTFSSSSVSSCTVVGTD